MPLTAVDAAPFPGAGAATATLGDARSDTRRRAIVDNAIAVMGDTNMMSAFEYLRRHDIGGQVIERVLLEPLRRRSTS